MWWVRFRMNGAHIRRSAKTAKKAEAQAYLHRLMEEHALAQRGDIRHRHLLSDAIDRFFEETSLRASTIETYRYTSRVVTRLMGRFHLDEINKRNLAEFITTRKRTSVSDATIRRDLAFIGSIFTAAKQWGWVDTSPVTALDTKALKESQPRTRFLTREEFRRLHDSASANLKPILVLAVETGLRKEELLSLRIAGIDLQRLEIHLSTTKAGRPRRVPLSPLAAQTVRGLLERSRPRSPYLLCKDDGSRFRDPKKAFAGACSRAGIEDFRYHDLRHTFASWWVQNGGDLYKLSRILGHATLQMTARYSHLRTDDLHEELERVSARRSQERSQERLIEPPLASETLFPAVRSRLEKR